MHISSKHIRSMIKWHEKHENMKDSPKWGIIVPCMNEFHEIPTKLCTHARNSTSFFHFMKFKALFSSMTCQWIPKMRGIHFYMICLHELMMSVLPNVEFECGLSLIPQSSSNSLQILLPLSKVSSSRPYFSQISTQECLHEFIILDWALYKI